MSFTRFGALVLSTLLLSGCGFVGHSTINSIADVQGMVSLPSELNCATCDIVSTTKDGSYGTAVGTSFAAPYVSAAAGMLMAQGVPANEVEQRLTDSARPLGIGKGDPIFGAGLLDAAAALGASTRPVLSVVSTIKLFGQKNTITNYQARPIVQSTVKTKSTNLQIHVSRGKEKELRDFLQKHGYQAKEHNAVWLVEGGSELERLSMELQKQKMVERLSLSPVWQAFGTQGNDTYINQQWALPYSAFTRSWDRAAILGQTTIAILDTGVNMNHPDFQGVQWTSACNMVDDGAQEVDYPPAYLEDGISPSDAIKTRRSVDDYCWSSTPMETMPVHGHGTIVTGIIAAIRGNGVGISGAGYAADNSMFRIMPVKVLNSAGEGDPITVAYGIYYAVMMGANVINLSLGGPAGTITPPEMQHAIEYALDHNVVVVAASGNDYAAQVSPPANMRDVIAVGAATIWGMPANYSNHGPGLDLIAPGGGQISSLIMASTTGPESGVVNANAIALTSNVGVFEISTLPAGEYSYFYAWIDTDLNDRINNGDYYDVVGPLLLRKNSSDMLRLQLHAYSGPDIAVQWRQARY